MTNLDQMRETYRATLGEIDRAVGGGLADRTATKAQFIGLDPIARRMAVKSGYALVEAMTYALKREALVDFPERLSNEERAICAGEEYRLKDSGDATVRRAKLRTLPNTKFAFKVLSKAAGAGFELDLDSAGWRQLRDGLKVRDRLTHPKSPSDLVVTDPEIAQVMGGLDWFQDQIIEVLRLTGDALSAHVADLRDRLEARRRQAETTNE